MNDVFDIQNDLHAGELSISEIASKYGIDVFDVEMILSEMIEQELDESMDGDFDSAMASAGFGTDEDYGYYGDEF